MKLSTLLLSSLLMISMACNERKEAKPEAAPKWEWLYYKTGLIAIDASLVDDALRVGDTVFITMNKGGRAVIKLPLPQPAFDTNWVSLTEGRPEQDGGDTGAILRAMKRKPPKVSAGRFLWRGEKISQRMLQLNDSGIVMGGNPVSSFTHLIDSTWERVPLEEPYYLPQKKIIYPDTTRKIKGGKP